MRTLSAIILDIYDFLPLALKSKILKHAKSLLIRHTCNKFKERGVCTPVLQIDIWNLEPKETTVRLFDAIKNWNDGYNRDKVKMSCYCNAFEGESWTYDGNNSKCEGVSATQGSHNGLQLDLLSNQGFYCLGVNTKYRFSSYENPITIGHYDSNGHYEHDIVCPVNYLKHDSKREQNLFLDDTPNKLEEIGEDYLPIEMPDIITKITANCFWEFILKAKEKVQFQFIVIPLPKSWLDKIALSILQF